MKTLHSFSGPPDGAYPYSGIALGPGGVLYGTTYWGGTGPCSGGAITGCGTVFSLTPPAASGDRWTETVITSLQGTGGSNPFAGVTVGVAGSLFGTALLSGRSNEGSVFMVNPSTADARVVHQFAGFPRDGGQPYGALVRGQQGVLYGTTNTGGAFNGGTVFSLAPPPSAPGPWTETILHSFACCGSDTGFPQSPVTIGPGGVLYGTGGSGPENGIGAVYSLAPPAAPGDQWTETLLHVFTGTPDGSDPATAGVVVGSGGILYGATRYGGAFNYGMVYSLTPPATPGAPWTESALYSFTGGSDGAYPNAVVLASKGVLYGTTQLGGTPNNGTIFSLTPPTAPGGLWTESVLVAFKGADGSTPQAGLTIGPGGVLYGTTTAGGVENEGTVFALIP